MPNWAGALSMGGGPLAGPLIGGSAARSGADGGRILGGGRRLGGGGGAVLARPIGAARLARLGAGASASLADGRLRLGGGGGAFDPDERATTAGAGGMIESFFVRESKMSSPEPFLSLMMRGDQASSPGSQVPSAARVRSTTAQSVTPQKSGAAARKADFSR
jgi:hypothetical protein